MELIKKTWPLLIIFIALATPWGVGAAESQSYGELNYRVLDQMNAPNMTFKERAEKFVDLSQSRLDLFLNDTAGISSTITVDQIQELNYEFRSSVYIGEEADMVLPRHLKNTICYLRALWLHMKLLAMGVPDQNIRKLVLDGYIEHESLGERPWDYHIVTTVKASDNNWYVLDLETSKAKTAQDWLSTYEAVQAQGRLQSRRFLFLLSIRPSHQYTLIDHVYDLNIDFGPEVRALFESLLENDKGFATQLRAYIQDLHEVGARAHPLRTI